MSLFAPACELEVFTFQIYNFQHFFTVGKPYIFKLSAQLKNWRCAFQIDVLENCNRCAHVLSKIHEYLASKKSNSIIILLESNNCIKCSAFREETGAPVDLNMGGSHLQVMALFFILESYGSKISCIKYFA